MESWEEPEEPEEVIYPTEEPWFNYKATLRIHGQNLNFNKITASLGVAPTYQHHRGQLVPGGEKRREKPCFPDDAWHYKAAVDETKTALRCFVWVISGRTPGCWRGADGLREGRNGIVLGHKGPTPILPRRCLPPAPPQPACLRRTDRGCRWFLRNGTERTGVICKA
jgi:hypothetical protein